MQIRQANLYLREGEELSFYEIILRARQRREIVIGYRQSSAERAIINPPAKNERQRWSLKDVFVVIAEKEWVLIVNHIKQDSSKREMKSQEDHWASFLGYIDLHKCMQGMQLKGRYNIIQIPYSRKLPKKF